MPQGRPGSQLALAGRSQLALAGGSQLPLAGRSQLALAGRSQLPLAGRSQLALAGRSQLALAGKLQLALARRSQLALAGRSQLALAGGSQLPLAGRSQLPLAGRSQLPLAGRPSTAHLPSGAHRHLMRFLCAAWHVQACVGRAGAGTSSQGGSCTPLEVPGRHREAGHQRLLVGCHREADCVRVLLGKDRLKGGSSARHGEAALAAAADVGQASPRAARARQHEDAARVAGQVHDEPAVTQGWWLSHKGGDGHTRAAVVTQGW
eukprot:363301-Chlamydomonas_euryale.AAC.8